MEAADFPLPLFHRARDGVAFPRSPESAASGVFAKTIATKALMRTLVLNSPELRSALKGIYEGAETLTEVEWRALLGARRQLESGAARQRREWLREELAESGLALWLQWGIMDRLKSRDFTWEELEAEIKAARENSTQPGMVEVKGVA